MGNFSSSTCTVTIPLPLLREPHIIHNTTFSTSSQRTEAGSGGISWAFPLVEGGETLPSSCSPLLATLDIATWLEQGQGRCHCELRPLRCSQLRECIHVISSARGQRSPAAREEWEPNHFVGPSKLDVHSRPPHCLRVCLVAHSILMNGQGFPFLATPRRARPIFRMQRENSPTKTLRNQSLEKPEICEK